LKGFELLMGNNTKKTHILRDVLKPVVFRAHLLWMKPPLFNKTNHALNQLLRFSLQYAENGRYLQRIGRRRFGRNPGRVGQQPAIGRPQRKVRPVLRRAAVQRSSADPDMLQNPRPGLEPGFHLVR